MVSERNLVNSFRLAKNDIIQIQQELLNIKEQQTELLQKIGKLIEKKGKIQNSKTKTVVKTIKKIPKKIYIASKEGGKFHNVNCPFAKNIKPKSKIIFKTKTSALNKGYKPCRCV